MPHPHAGESKNQFIGEFMGSSEAQHSFPDQKQRVAVAESIWRREHHEKRADFVERFMCDESHRQHFPEEHDHRNLAHKCFDEQCKYDAMQGTASNTYIPGGVNNPKKHFSVMDFFASTI